MARNRLYIGTTSILLACILASACQPRQAAPTADIHAIVATSMASTQRARALATLVAATFSAIAAAPPETPSGGTPPPTATQTTDASHPSTPGDACASGEADKTLYIDAQVGYCFLYPADFFVSKPGAGIVEFLGKPLDSNPDPVRARINITRKEPVSSRTLDEIATSLWHVSLNPYRLSNIQLGGQDALVAEDLMLGETSWKVKQLFFTRNGSVYLITFSPVDPAAPYAKALPDIQRFWDTMVPSFNFTK